MKNKDKNSKNTVLYICDKKGRPVCNRVFWIEPKKNDAPKAIQEKYYETDSEGKISFGGVYSQKLIISIANDFVQHYNLNQGKNTMRITLVYYR